MDYYYVKTSQQYRKKIEKAQVRYKNLSKDNNEYPYKYIVMCNVQHQRYLAPMPSMVQPQTINFNYDCNTSSNIIKM